MAEIVSIHKDSTFLAWATTYAEHRLHVIPVWRAIDGGCQCPKGKACISPGKHPTIDSWQSDGSIETTTIRDWFAHPKHNMGIVCGLSKLLVIDIDPRNGGEETFARLVAELGPLPETITSHSGGGGIHFLFKRPPGDLLGKFGPDYPGVDILRDGRQFLVEPSVHPSGNMYRWRDGRGPSDIGLAELPTKWIDRVIRPKYQPPPPRIHTAPDEERVRRARAYLAKCAPAIEGNHGHDALYNAVSHVLVGFDLSDADTRSLIINDYNPRCEPPFNERDINHKIESARKTTTRAFGYLLGDRPRVTTRAAASSNARPASTPPANWRTELIVKNDTTPKRCYHNVRVFVRFHPEFAGKWTLDLMTDMPWFDGAPVTTPLIHEIRSRADQVLCFTPSVEDVTAAIHAASLERAFHPIRQYLQSLDWDGTPRLHLMARDYLGSSESHHAEMLRRFMIGAVARAFQPGCKLDTALMLVGAQGIGKSTFFSLLGGEWHADSFVDIQSRDGLMQIHSAWIYELAELENVVHGSKESRLKAWITTTHDTYRAPYAKAVGRKARSVVFCGTTNRERFLTDDTGSRRFWIIPVCDIIPRDRLLASRDQLWAEALCAYEQGEAWWLDSETDAVRQESNEQHYEEDSWTEIVARGLTPIITEITTSDVLTNILNIEVGRHDKVSQMRVGRVLKTLGWSKARKWDGKRVYRIWCKDGDNV